MKIEIDDKLIPAGYEVVGFGIVRTGEPYAVPIHKTGKVDADLGDGRYPQIFGLRLRKIEVWREPRFPEDYGREARFWDNDEKAACTSCLSGFLFKTDSMYKWVDSAGAAWKHCEVKDDAHD